MCKLIYIRTHTYIHTYSFVYTENYSYIWTVKYGCDLQDPRMFLGSDCATRTSWSIFLRLGFCFSVLSLCCWPCILALLSHCIFSAYAFRCSATNRLIPAKDRGELPIIPYPLSGHRCFRSMVLFSWTWHRWMKLGFSWTSEKQGNGETGKIAAWPNLESKENGTFAGEFFTFACLGDRFCL